MFEDCRKWPWPAFSRLQSLISLQANSCSVQIKTRGKWKTSLDRNPEMTTFHSDAVGWITVGQAMWPKAWGKAAQVSGQICLTRTMCVTFYLPYPIVQVKTEPHPASQLGSPSTPMWILIKIEASKTSGNILLRLQKCVGTFLMDVPMHYSIMYLIL